MIRTSQWFATRFALTFLVLLCFVSLPGSVLAEKTTADAPDVCGATQQIQSEPPDICGAQQPARRSTESVEQATKDMVPEGDTQVTEHAEAEPSPIERVDELWQTRHRSDSVNAMLQILNQLPDQLKSSYDAQWRLARTHWWIADQTDDVDKKSAEGKLGMEFAKKALELDPNGFHGHYYYSLSVGAYSQGISIVTALRQGMKSEFEDHAEKAYQMDKAFDEGGPCRALGRFHQQLTWLLRDCDKSLEYLQEALEIEPRQPRTHLYLADTYYCLGEKEKAKKELQFVLDQELPEDVPFYSDLPWAKRKARELMQDYF